MQHNYIDAGLIDRFKTTLADTRLFDMLVGYFRSSGIYQLYDKIELIGKTRILVGLSIDYESYLAIDFFRSQVALDFDSHKNTKAAFQNNLIREIEDSDDSDDKLELGLKKFIELLQMDCLTPNNDKERGGNGKKLEIRAFPSRNIHAKVYIGRFTPEDRDFGFVITGSSNFSYAGLVENREFNVELRQRRDVEYALDQFEDLWRQSVDISNDFIDTVQKKTWLNDSITPYDPNPRIESRQRFTDLLIPLSGLVVGRHSRYETALESKIVTRPLFHTPKAPLRVFWTDRSRKGRQISTHFVK